MIRQAQALAVLMRSARWELDEAAFEVGGGRYTAQQRLTLANQLEELVRVLRIEELDATPEAPH